MEMHIWYIVLITLLAGMGAGLGTGFAGMSAAVVISPMLITFLNIPPYTAVGIALASDVLASGISAYTYGKHKHLDIKNGLVMMASVLLFTFVGSLVSKYIPAPMMGGFSNFMTIFLGLRFIIKPITTTKNKIEELSMQKRIIQSIVCGAVIGFICGFIGAGGGMMMLFILTTILGYELKTAVGTSVFIMAFTALTGAISHFTLGDAPNLMVLGLCVIFTLIWAQVASLIANRVKPIVLNRATGVVLMVLGIAIVVFTYVIPA